MLVQMVDIFDHPAVLINNDYRIQGHLQNGSHAGLAIALALLVSMHVPKAVLGAGWGILYLVRRSIVASVVSHAAFNLAQLAVFAAVAR